jgi:hypothetical protein
MKTLQFQISDEAFELLKQIKQEWGAEYRDFDYKTLDEFKQSNDFKRGILTESQFLNRNFNGTFYLILELQKYNLVEIDDNSYHSTYILTDFGKEILKNQK